MKETITANGHQFLDTSPIIELTKNPHPILQSLGSSGGVFGVSGC
jgi:hypothetical protein